MPTKARKPKRKKISVRKVILPHSGVVQVIAPKDVHPVVVHEEPGVVKIIPVRKEREIGWMEYLFG